MHTLLLVIFVSVVLKAFIIGSSFNFGLWLKYGKEYTNWYNNEERI